MIGRAIDRVGLSADLDTRPEDDRNARRYGHQIPITDPKTLYDREDVHVLISAWQYADPIMSKHRSLSEQGSSFIIPLPTVEVV